MTIRRYVLPLLGLLMCCAAGFPQAGKLLQQEPVMSNADRLRPWAANPHYWQYKGQPVLLVGGSREDNLFQIPDLREHLDLLASVGGNVIRNTMSDRDEGDVYPYQRRADGRYDLRQWNEEYWARFANLLRLTHERDIIVQIEVWDRFDLSRGSWQRHPYRPANNVNYSAEQSGLADAYPDHPGADKQPFFHTIPGMPQYQPKYDLLRGYQERFVAQMLSYSLPHGHVLYCMDNETSTDPRWGQYWMRFIKQRAQEAGVDVFVTDMFDDGFQPEKSAQIRLVLDRPDLYDFIDISQVNSRNFGEDHWRRLTWVMEANRKTPRPVNHTKIYSDGQTSWGSGTPQDGVERFWRNLLAGSASSRFHRPTAGIGLNEQSQACLRAARLVETMVRFWDLQPHQELLSDREANEAYLAARPGEAYVLFFCKGGAVGLDLTAAAGALKLRWIEVATGKQTATATLQGGAPAPVTAPGEAPWVAVITP
ncbi:MAG: hypothetical protein KKI08_12950 [Armatimonadetes bacterium]|nr:hypothetical protein [Armatimonadota bacterium]